MACSAEGETILENAAREPEVVALGNLLVSLGAKIEGLGTTTIRVQGGRLSAPKKPIVIPADRIDSIWEPYVTGKAGGTGLGLAIVKQTVVAHRGHVEAESGLGTGAVIRLIFPAAMPAGPTA